MLEVRGLHYRYGTKEVLAGVDATFAPGQMTAVIGPNGSGKTTLMRLLSGIAQPTAGTVLLDGQAVGRLSPRARARQIAVVTQQAQVSFPFTAWEVVLMGRNPYVSALGSEGPEDYAAAHRAMEEAGVADFSGRPITELSGGEAQRVIAARALAQAAPVLLLDEPVANLDIRHQAGLLSLFRRKAEEGATVVCVLHDLNMALRYAHRVLVLCSGRVACFGPPEEALTPEILEPIYQQKLVVLSSPDGRFLAPVDER